MRCATFYIERGEARGYLYMVYIRFRRVRILVFAEFACSRRVHVLAFAVHNSPILLSLRLLYVLPFHTPARGRTRVVGRPLRVGCSSRRVVACLTSLSHRSLLLYVYDGLGCAMAASLSRSHVSSTPGHVRS